MRLFQQNTINEAIETIMIREQVRAYFDADKQEGMLVGVTGSHRYLFLPLSFSQRDDVPMSWHGYVGVLSCADEVDVQEAEEADRDVLRSALSGAVPFPPAPFEDPMPFIAAMGMQESECFAAEIGEEKTEYYSAPHHFRKAERWIRSTVLHVVNIPQQWIEECFRQGLNPLPHVRQTTGLRWDYHHASIWIEGIEILFSTPSRGDLREEELISEEVREGKVPFSKVPDL